MLMTKPHNDFRLGLFFAVGSAVTFGMSGPFAKSLMEAGWSPTGAVTARLALGAVVMAIFATVVKPDWFREALQHSKTVIVYGLIPIAGAQLCYYNAVAHVSVAVALLLEYTAPLLVVGWLWATTRRRPSTKTLAGIGLAVAGIMVVLGIIGERGLVGVSINVTGIAWGLGAAICAGFYFMMSDEVSSDGDGLNSITLAAGGLIVGAAAVALLGVSGIMPLTFTANQVVVAGVTTSWLVPVVMLGVVSTALAYTLGISGVARLRPSFASLVGLAEVLCAVLWAWLLVGEEMTPAQAVGGAVVLAGLALARQGDKSPAVTAAAWPDAGVIEEFSETRLDLPPTASRAGDGGSR
jgi:drug/metabolite transporter (DMT)-like permease